eukprot:2795050-Prymnesium_polylepis.1
MTLVELALVLIYTCVLLIKSCNLSESVCVTFGFGNTAKGTDSHDCNGHALLCTALKLQLQLFVDVCSRGRCLHLSHILWALDAPHAATHRNGVLVCNWSCPQDSIGRHCARDFSVDRPPEGVGAQGTKPQAQRHLLVWNGHAAFGCENGCFDLS